MAPKFSRDNHMLLQRNRALNRENRELQKRIHLITKKNIELQAENSQLKEENRMLKKSVLELQENIDRLVKKLKNQNRHPNDWKKKQVKKDVPSNTESKRKVGRRSGFRGTSRKRPVNVDERIELRLDSCPSCQGKLNALDEIRTRRVVGIKMPQPWVKEYISRIYYCPDCKKKIYPSAPEEIPRCRITLELMLYIIFQKFALGLPYNKIRSHLKEYFGINLSEKTLCDSVQRIAKYLGPEFDKIVDEIRQLKAIHVDETGWRINGRNCWLWAFITKKASLITIEKNRDSKVLKKWLGSDFDGAIGCDFYSSYDKFGGRQQKCMTHLLRATKEISEKGNPEAIEFHKKTKKLVEDAKALRRAMNSLSPSSIMEEKAKLAEQLTQLSTQNYSDPDCIRLAKRLQKHKDHMFTFLDFPDLEYHNNSAERALRSSVVIRKISGGNRSCRGANAHRVIMSVHETAKLTGTSFLKKCKDAVTSTLNNTATAIRLS